MESAVAAVAAMANISTMERRSMVIGRVLVMNVANQFATSVWFVYPLKYGFVAKSFC